MKLSDKQIKQIEELTGYKLSKKIKPYKVYDTWWFINEHEFDYDFKELDIELKNKVISHYDYDGVYIGIPFKWLKPLSEILKDGNQWDIILDGVSND